VDEFISGPCSVFSCCGYLGDHRKDFFGGVYSSRVGGDENGSFFVEKGLFSYFSICPVRGSIVLSFSDSLDGVCHPGEGICYVYLSKVVIHSS
jgi:hypothetical protein